MLPFDGRFDLSKINNKVGKVLRRLGVPLAQLNVAQNAVALHDGQRVDRRIKRWQLKRLPFFETSLFFRQLHDSLSGGERSVAKPICSKLDLQKQRQLQFAACVFDLLFIEPEPQSLKSEFPCMVRNRFSVL